MRKSLEYHARIHQSLGVAAKETRFAIWMRSFAFAGRLCQERVIFREASSAAHC
jgi:hypothetical protein